MLLAQNDYSRVQRLTGDGWAFIHAGGALHERTLGPGETLRVDTGCIVAFQPSVSYDIQLVGGIKTALFGGEGLFFEQALVLRRLRFRNHLAPIEQLFKTSR